LWRRGREEAAKTAARALRAAAPSGRRVAVTAAKLRDFAARARSGVWNLERKQMGGTQRAGGKARTARTGGAFRFA